MRRPYSESPRAWDLAARSGISEVDAAYAGIHYRKPANWFWRSLAWAVAIVSALAALTIASSGG